jgi:hypothetical protein
MSNAALVVLLLCQAHAAVHMIMEYKTDGSVELNHANFTIRTVSINVTLLGCDYGYYDHYLLHPPPAASPRYQITPFDCRPCVCTEFETMRAEEFMASP